MTTTNSTHTCPWWLLPTFDNPLRRLIHPAEMILAPFVKSGDVVLEPGCGMGYFTMAMAHLVGETGKVIAVDVQSKMLEGLERRARRTGIETRIQAHLCLAESLGIEGPVDFALAFWMVHEVPNRQRFLTDIHHALRPGAALLVVEPRLHVSKRNFDRTLEIGRTLGFRLEEGPHVRLSRSAILRKP
ncbi:MAG: hypothetical protein RL318_1755 [Fibrobacterota bacterium]|jgi:ubiquinone/menaquinone biosynthesis C-methylase UbiE